MKKTFLLVGLGVGITAVMAVSAVYAAGNNYATWRATIGNSGSRAASVVTEQNFDQFTQMHQLMADGKYDEAQKIRTDLGLGQGTGNGAGGCGMNKNGGCPMHAKGQGTGENFIDANNNGICDHMEQVAK